MTKARKKGRPRSEDPMVHTAVVLPRALLERLKTDAERSATGLSTEIRQRLLATYDLEAPPRDPRTTELVERIESLTESLARDLGKKWHESRYALAALKGGLATFLAPYEPKDHAGSRDADDPVDNPETVGRTHARLIMAAQHNSEER